MTIRAYRMFWAHPNREGGKKLISRADNSDSSSELKDIAVKAIMRKDHKLLMHVVNNENVSPRSLDIIAEYVDKGWSELWLRSNTCPEMLNGELTFVDASAYFELIREGIARHPNTAPGGPADRVRRRLQRN